ncbi:MAG: hypothetical protein D3910_10620 [Candidatus Electrothrix sp. ATG2]|nr:hypothetical protein [Candidatus Electrothrix sp. ATG2]
MIKNKLYPINILLLFILFSPQNVFPADVSKFDIKGIHLGDSYSKIKNKIPCSNPIVDKRYVDGSDKYIYNTLVDCTYDKEGGFYLIFSRDKKITEIHKGFLFPDVQPDHKQLIKKIISKYGQPTMSTNCTSDSEGNSFKMCWGDCIKYDLKNNRYWHGASIKPGKHGQSLLVELSTNRAETQTALTLTLQDYLKINNTQQWREKMRLQVRKEKANIDF